MDGLCLTGLQCYPNVHYGLMVKCSLLKALLLHHIHSHASNYSGILPRFLLEFRASFLICVHNFVLVWYSVLFLMIIHFIDCPSGVDIFSSLVLTFLVLCPPLCFMLWFLIDIIYQYLCKFWLPSCSPLSVLCQTRRPFLRLSPMGKHTAKIIDSWGEPGEKSANSFWSMPNIGDISSFMNSSDHSVKITKKY